MSTKVIKEAYPLLGKAVQMLIRTSILSTCLILGLSCSPDEDRTEVEFKKPLTPTTLPVQTSGAFLQNTEETIDYKAKYTNSPPKDDRLIMFHPFQSPRPPSWFWVPPKSTVVTCNYTVPGIDGSDSAFFSITQFEPGEGGTLSANVERWNQLFNTHDGGPVKPTIKTVTTPHIRFRLLSSRLPHTTFGTKC